MREIKTYENFITNLFTKNKKLPSEMYDLSGALVNIISYYMNNILKKNLHIRYFENELNDKKNYNTITIISEDPSTRTFVYKIARLYYKEDLNDIMFYLIDPDISMIKLKDFFVEKIKNFDPNCKFDTSFFIALDKVQSVINEITIENLEEFLTEKKYNL